MAAKPHLHAVSQLESQYEPLLDLVFDTPLVNIGRALTNNYVIPHISISRQHCCFKQIGDSWFINDKSSTGILINDQTIPKATDHPLKHNDIIRFDFNGIFVYSFNNISENCDYKPLPTCTHSDIYKWIQNPNRESDPNQNRDLSNVASQLQTYEEKRVAVVNQKSILQSKHTEDLLLLENTYQAQIQQLKGDSEAIKLQKEELLMKVEKDKEELESKFKATTDSLEQKIKKYASQVEALMEENKTLIENFNNERKAYEKQIQEITNMSEKKVEDLEKMLNDKDSDFHKQKEMMEKKMIEDAKILKNNMELVSEYKNKCIALEAEKKETEEKLTKDKDQLSNRIAEIETNMENSTTQKRTHDEMQSGSASNYSDILESELMCTICMEYFISAVTLGCSHTFCKDCIIQWQSQSTECPFCREPITAEADCRTIDSIIDKIVLNLDEDAKKKRQEIIDERKSREPPKKKRVGIRDRPLTESEANRIREVMIQQIREHITTMRQQSRTRAANRQNVLNSRAIAYRLRRRNAQ